MPEDAKNGTSCVALSKLTAALRLHTARWAAQQPPVWVVAEVAKCKHHASGHCYLTLVEKSGANLLARVDAMLWASENEAIKRFEQAAGGPISLGNTVRARGQVQFHPTYGLSLVLSDIQPLHALGEMERQKRAAFARLEREELLGLNKIQLLPLAPQRVLVISSDTAAGYLDFCQTLRRNPQGYAFSVFLLPAMLQGQGAAASLLSALRRAEECAGSFDALVILRGGGAPEDLQAFNDYALAAAIARFSLPVITGIGHERDQTLADIVAHTALPTPMSAAQFLIERMQALEERFHLLQEQVETAARAVLAGEQARLEQQAARAIRTTERQLRCQERAAQVIADCLKRRCALKLARLENRLTLHAARLASITSTLVCQRQADLQRFGKALAPRSQQALRQASAHLENLRGTLRDRHPRHILKRGYCLVRRGGRILLPSDEIRVGERVEIETLRGRFIARVEQTEEDCHGDTTGHISTGY